VRGRGTCVGGRGPVPQNAMCERGDAANRVRRLWPPSQDINSILGGERSDADQQHAPPEQHQLSHGLPPGHVASLSFDGEAQFVVTTPIRSRNNFKTICFPGNEVSQFGSCAPIKKGASSRR